MDLLSFFFLHEMRDADMQGFQNLDESAINQLGSFRFSLQVAALELSETWSYFIEQERQVSHASALHMMLSGARNLIERSACGGKGLNNPMQLRIKIVHPRQPCSLVLVHA